MGIVIRQGLKSTAVQYAGVLIGAVANLFLYTQLEAEYGLVQVLIVIANVILPFAMLGSYSLAVRFYPQFKTPDAGRQGFLTLLLLVSLTGIALYWLVAPLLDDWLMEKYLVNTREDYRQYIKYVPALVVCMALIRLLFQYISNFRLIVVPTILEQLMFKLTLPVILLSFLLGWLSIEQVVLGVVLNYALALIGMFAYLAWLGELKLPLPSREVMREWRPMAGFAGYGIASMLGTLLAFKIDVVMVASFLGFEAAGQYTIVLFIAEVIGKPYTNVRSVLAPEVSSAWANNDLKKLADLYRRSSNNLLIISGYLFGGILVCYPSLGELATKGEVLMGAFTAFIFLGLSRVVDSATSINEYIVSFSNRYRFNLIAIAILAISNIWLNNVLIPIYGIAGAGLATLISLTLYNAAKVLFAGIVFNLWPFGKTTFTIIIALCVGIGAVWLIPQTGWWWLDIPLKGGLLTALLAAYVWWGKPTPDSTVAMQNVLRKLGVSIK